MLDDGLECTSFGGIYDVKSSHSRAKGLGEKLLSVSYHRFTFGRLGRWTFGRRWTSWRWSRSRPATPGRRSAPGCGSRRWRRRPEAAGTPGGLAGPLSGRLWRPPSRVRTAAAHFVATNIGLKKQQTKILLWSFLILESFPLLLWTGSIATYNLSKIFFYFHFLWLISLPKPNNRNEQEGTDGF